MTHEICKRPRKNKANSARAVVSSSGLRGDGGSRRGRRGGPGPRRGRGRRGRLGRGPRRAGMETGRPHAARPRAHLGAGLLLGSGRRSRRGRGARRDGNCGRRDRRAGQAGVGTGPRYDHQPGAHRSDPRVPAAGQALGQLRDTGVDQSRPANRLPRSPRIPFFGAKFSEK
ncbi:MAG: hypothetical protein FJ280_20035 [Planctomycetes bacterium]|nr:hypothetical protein [Planctomycetota bacterium]